jgi:two-component system response regulator (stage 0 sporulation protein A)
VNKKVMGYLDEKGLKHASKGYGYVAEAIELAIEAPDIMRAVTKELYPAIAKNHGDTSSRVERAIRHCITSADFMVGDINGKMPNSEFIARAADELRDEA